MFMSDFSWRVEEVFTKDHRSLSEVVFEFRYDEVNLVSIVGAYQLTGQRLDLNDLFLDKKKLEWTIWDNGRYEDRWRWNVYSQTYT